MTIWIFVLVLLIAIQPVLAFHFCSGRLASVEVPSPVDPGCCPVSSSDHASDKQLMGDTCCHTSVVELSTDDYVRQDTLQKDVPFSVLVFLYARSVVADILFNSISSSERKAPPVYLNKVGRDVITRFCVYII